MSSDRKDIGKLLRKYGYAIPKEVDEIKSFEEKFGNEFVSPVKWPKIEDIINGDETSIDPKIMHVQSSGENKAAGNLAMAARDGKKISKKDREEMDKDKRNARKK